jgi:hypothetical protein
VHKGELVAAGGGILLLASMFLLPWFAVDAGGRLAPGARVSLDGWHALTTTRWVLLVTIAVSVALLLVTASRRSPAIPVTSSLVSCVFGGLSTLLLIYRLVDHPGLDPRAGAYVGLAMALTLGYGSYVSLRTESTPVLDPPLIETVRIGQTQPGPGERTGSTSAGRSGP